MARSDGALQRTNPKAFDDAFDMESGGIQTARTPKDALKERARNLAVRLKDLLVLAPQNDPFNCGGPEQIRQADWFAQMWHQFIDARAHLRKLHYLLVSHREPILKADGSRYQNTQSDWDRLQDWSKYARYLGLVDPRDVVDNRNPEPYLFAPNPVEPEIPGWQIEDGYGFTVPEISTSIWSDFDLPRVEVEGYHYREGEQPSLVELWVEKSTMDDDLIPTCRTFGISLVTSTGFQSVTGAIAVLSRAGAWAALGRPVRIFYLSDFDPAGDSMPVAVSRQLEFWHEQSGAWETRIDDVRREAEALEERARRTVEEFHARLLALAEEFDDQMQPIREQAEAIEDVMTQLIEATDLPDDILPPRPTATVSPGDESKWLFASGRTFAEQLESYRAHKGEP